MKDFLNYFLNCFLDYLLSCLLDYYQKDSLFSSLSGLFSEMPAGLRFSGLFSTFVSELFSEFTSELPKRG